VLGEITGLVAGGRVGLNVVGGRVGLAEVGGRVGLAVVGEGTRPVAVGPSKIVGENEATMGCDCSNLRTDI
jgi:hypothetical protein